MVETTEKPAALDWDALLTADTVTEVAQLAPSRTVDDIPAKIRELLDGLHTSGTIGKVTLPNGAAAKVFAREVRDYTFMHEPRWTARLKHVSDTEVRVKVVTYEAPKPAVA